MKERTLAVGNGSYTRKTQVESIRGVEIVISNLIKSGLQIISKKERICGASKPELH